MNFSNNSPLKNFFYIKKIPRCGCHSMLAFLLFRAENYSNQGNCHSENFQCNICQNIPTSHKIYHSFYDTLNDSINTEFFLTFLFVSTIKSLFFLSISSWQKFDLLNMHSFYSWLLHNDTLEKNRRIEKFARQEVPNTLISGI